MIPEPARIPDVISHMVGEYRLDATAGALLKMRDESEKYYEWRQAILNRVEMTRYLDRWLVAGWTDSPNAAGVSIRMPWYAEVEKRPSDGVLAVSEVKLIDLDP